jgi:hypothetical protein
MIDALTAARSALPAADAPSTTDGGQLFVTGYSQGGYVAMATHRALQDEAQTVTASAPMSGRYALSAFGDAIFQGQVTGGSPVNLTLLITSYQNAYGDIYSDTTDVFEAQYATDIDTLLPSTTPVGELEEQGRLPDTALFSSTPPDPAYAAMTPATTPANLAPVFAMGFGTDHLLTNAFRLAYLQDADANPDSGFPELTDGLPPADPEHPLGAQDQRPARLDADVADAAMRGSGRPWPGGHSSSRRAFVSRIGHIRARPIAPYSMMYQAGTSGCPNRSTSQVDTSGADPPASASVTL